MASVAPPSGVNLSCSGPVCGPVSNSFTLMSKATAGPHDRLIDCLHPSIDWFVILQMELWDVADDHV